MIFDIRLYIIIGIYMIICISLMIFNFMVVRKTVRQSAAATGISKKWKAIIYKQAVKASGGEISMLKHARFLLKKLANTEALIAFSHALHYLKGEFPEAYNDYIYNKYNVFENLANIYNEKTSVERACYADFICDFPEAAGDSHERTVGALISYIDKSNIYCRTNVLRALCSIGSVSGVMNALQVINDKQLFIHTQLLTDELLRFKGNKEDLGKYLWSEAWRWNDNIKVSVIQFIAQSSNSYNEEFLSVLQDSSVSAEVRIAVIRYYAENSYAPAQAALIKLTDSSANITLAAEAVLALASHPTPDAIAALREALYSQEWSVRYNASSVLVGMGNEIDLTKVLRDDSEYARKIVSYMLEREEALQPKETEGEKVSA